MFSLGGLVGAIYFAVLALTAIRSGEIARFNGTVFSGMMLDASAEALPQTRWLKYIDRAESPKRFWMAVFNRCLLSVLSAIMAIGFLLMSLNP